MAPQWPAFPPQFSCNFSHSDLTPPDRNPPPFGKVGSRATTRKTGGWEICPQWGLRSARNCIGLCVGYWKLESGELMRTGRGAVHGVQREPFPFYMGQVRLLYDSPRGETPRCDEVRGRGFRQWP